MSPRVRNLVLIVITLMAVAAVVLVRSGGAEDDGITTDVAVHVGQVARDTVHRYVTAYGRVDPEPALDGRPAAGAWITPFVDGVISSVEAVEGQRVQKGTVLFRLDSRMARVALRKAQQQAAFADSAFMRQEQLLGADGTSRRAYLDARLQRDAAHADLAAAETGLSYLNITAPLTGTVLHLDGEVGMHVDATTPLARVVDLNRLVVTADVPAREMDGLAVGQPVRIATSDPGLEGTVLVLGRDVDPTTGTVRVQASVPPGAGLTPGRFTEIHIIADSRPDVLVVPVEAVVTRGGESWIAVVEGDSAVRRTVRVGLREDDRVEVSGEGLREGLRIVTIEAYSLPPETRIEVVDG